MQWVESPTMWPSSCVLSNSTEGPMIDLGREGEDGRRLYVHPQVVAELAEFVGGRSAEQTSTDALEVQLLRQRLAELEKIAEEHAALKAAVALTLQHGATIDRKGQPKLRQAHGGARVNKKVE